MRKHDEALCNGYEMLSVLDNPELTAEYRTRAIKARYPGKDVLSGEPISPGEQIVYFVSGWIHAEDLD